MAAIIAHITKQNWERKKNAKRYCSADKSVYFLPRFDPCFDPKKHNSYVKRKLYRTETSGLYAHDEKIKEYKLKYVEAMKAKKKAAQEAESWDLQCLKATVGVFLIGVPIAIMVFLLITFLNLEPVEVVQFTGGGKGSDTP